jgi:hypothetical protein
MEGEAMTATIDPSGKGSPLRDLVITAAVATVVSALVSPWLRRWMDPGPSGMGQVMPASMPPTGAPDEFEARLDRLLEVPDSFSNAAVAISSSRRERHGETNRRRKDVDVEEDREP